MSNFTRPIVTLLFFFTVALSSLQAQDPRFSQYYASPWNLNPALTGVFNGRLRVAANYRDQWSSILGSTPFRTYSVAVDGRAYVGRSDLAGVGIGVMHDEAGTARFSQNRIHIGGSYLKKIAGGRYSNEHYVCVGAQLGAGQNSLDFSKLWFSRQFNTTTAQPDLTAGSGEPNLTNSTKIFADFNAGLLWYTILENEGFFYAGGAIHHINRPAISLIGDSRETLYSRYSIQAGGLLPISETFSVMPGLLVMQQGPAFETDFGLNVRYSNHDVNELALRFGAWGRIGNRLNSGLISDAVTVTGMVEWNRFVVGVSYDITVSSLSLANNARGAFEMSVMYTHPMERRSRITCPAF
jgi:type IX secretion system PorP/SprF family membrane protein